MRLPSSYGGSFSPHLPPRLSGLQPTVPVLSHTRHCLLCGVFAVHKHGVTYQAHSVVYIFMFFHSVIMASTCILMLSLPVIGTVPVGLPARSPTGTPLSLTSCTHCCYLLCTVGGLLFQQEDVQAIGIYPGNFTDLADALLSCGELTSILRLLAFSQALVWFFCLGLFEDGITGLRHYP